MDVWIDGRMDGQTDIQSFSSSYRTLSLIRAASQKAEQGKVTTDYILSLDNFLGSSDEVL